MVETVVNIQNTSHTTTSSPEGGLTAIRINLGYFTSLPGILKIIQIVLGIICMSCASPAAISATSFFLFVVVVGFIGTVLWSFAYFLGIREALHVAVNWVLSELINTGIITLLYFISSIIQLANWSGYPHFWYGKYIAAGIFGVFNTVAYAAGTYFLFLLHRSGSTL